MNYKIYVDLDQVLTDFEKQVVDNLHKYPKDFKKKSEMWKGITKLGTNFWSEMEFMHDGLRLWEYLKKFNPTILSAPINHPSCKQGKGIWIRRELGDDVEYILDSKKEKYATPESILIDDRIQNIKKWEAAGGIGILHKNVEDTINQLKKLFGKETTFKNYYDDRSQRL